MSPRTILPQIILFDAISPFRSLFVAHTGNIQKSSRTSFLAVIHVITNRSTTIILSSIIFLPKSLFATYAGKTQNLSCKSSKKCTVLSPQKSGLCPHEPLCNHYSLPYYFSPDVTLLSIRRENPKLISQFSKLKSVYPILINF